MEKRALSRVPFHLLHTLEALLFGAALSALGVAANGKTLAGHVPRPVPRLAAIGTLAGTNEIHLSIGLPLRDQEGLTELLHQLYDPASPRFRQYLSPEEFTAHFGPSEEEYQQVIAFAKANGFAISSMHPNRMLLGVTASTRAVEQAFGLRMRLYAHPSEDRFFFSNDAEPAVAATLPILHISGLNDFTLPRPMDLRVLSNFWTQGEARRQGTGMSGTYTGSDFRKAYVPGTTLTGAGEKVGLFELNGYYPTDISAYLAQTGLSSVPLQNVLIDNFNGSPGARRPGSPNEEVALDIEMAISMAPGLAAVLVYEGSPAATTATINHILNRMATDNLARQLSCSWGFDIDINTQQIFKQFAAQGQSFFLASGDSGAFAGIIVQPSDNPFATVVGGTDLTTDSKQGWVSETVWPGTSGGISSVYQIPSWQAGTDMSTNQGSVARRNVPDVAMVGNAVMAIADRGRSLPLSGTSIAAPLWAGFTALINEQAAAQGQSPVGFINPALYALGNSSNFTAAFHDITTGNNTNKSSLGRFFAVPGYDLCTGWGTPNGTNFINAILGLTADRLLLSSPLGFTANGPVGGPFNISSQLYRITNLQAAPLSWEVVSTAPWLSVSPTGGVLRADASWTNVTVALNTNATAFLIGRFSAAVSFRNLTDGTSQLRRFLLEVGNGGFESGDFTNWTFRGQSDVNFADSIDLNDFTGQDIIPEVDDSHFVHSGIYGAFLGQNTSLGFLSQTLPTVPGKQYVLSFWLANPAQGAPNQFRAEWNDSVLFDQSDMPLTTWTNLQYLVTAGSTNSTLQFAFQNDQNAFALDDISLGTTAAPRIRSAAVLSGQLQMAWSTIPGLRYQLQRATSIDASQWVDVGDPFTATGDSAIISQAIDSSEATGFFRLIQL